jgi:hypothetical protein
MECYNWNELCNQLSGAESFFTRQATQEFPNILWNPKFYCRVHNIPPLDHILRQINPFHTTPSYFFKIHFNITLLLISRHSFFSFLLVCHQNPICIQLLLILATFSAYLTLLDLIVLIILDEEYRLWSSSLCSFLQSPLTLSLFCSKYSPQHPVLKHPQSMLLP